MLFVDEKIISLPTVTFDPLGRGPLWVHYNLWKTYVLARWGCGRNWASSWLELTVEKPAILSWQEAGKYVKSFIARAQQASCRFLSDHVQKIAAHERSMVATQRGKNETDHEQQHRAQNAPRARRSHSIRRALLGSSSSTTRASAFRNRHHCCLSGGGVTTNTNTDQRGNFVPLAEKKKKRKSNRPPCATAAVVAIVTFVLPMSHVPKKPEKYDEVLNLNYLREREGPPPINDSAQSSFVFAKHR